MTMIAIKELETLCLNALIKAGLREKDAALTVEHYLENELSGKTSHGMVRIVEAINAVRKHGAPTQDPEIATDNGALAILESYGQIGAVAAISAMQESISRTKKYGISFVGVRNYIASAGSMAFYLRRITDRGLIALMGCNSIALVSPPKGRERMLGTNPIGIGFPGKKEIFIGDLATSAIAFGKIMVLQDKGEPVPEGALIDGDGNPSINPNDAFNGSILPLADYKGFSLAMMIMFLSGSLIGAKDLKKNLYDGDGLFILSIDPTKLGHNHFDEMVSETLKEIKDSARQPNASHISIPGERSEAELQKNLKAGKIKIVDKTLQDLQELVS